jgi:hypothetical protein
MSGTHCTYKEEVKYLNEILVRKPEEIIPLLKCGLDKRGISIAINAAGEQARVEGGLHMILWHRLL